MNSKFFKGVAITIIIVGIILGFVLVVTLLQTYYINLIAMFVTWIVAVILALRFAWMSEMLKKLEEITGGDYEYEYVEGTVTITSYTGTELEVVIPTKVDGRPVATIGENAFEGYDMTFVAIQDGVTMIESTAFNHCTQLESVSFPSIFPSTLKKIDGFKGCSNLKTITIPDGATEIACSAFQDCKSLESVTIPDTVTKIESATFSNCSKLTEIYIPESVTYIGAFAMGYDGVTHEDNRFRGTRIKGFEIHGKAGSAAEKYAEKNEFKFVAE